MIDIVSYCDYHYGYLKTQAISEGIVILVNRLDD